MDGAGRFLRSIIGTLPAFAPVAGSRPAFAGASTVSAYETPRPKVRRERQRRLSAPQTALKIFAARSASLVLVVLVLGGAAGYGFVRGGQYDTFVGQYGGLGDVAARGLGFGIDVVTIHGARELHENEIMQAAGLNARNSLVFLDVAQVRERLKQVPLVAEVAVRKLYPDRLMIDITERTPFALWQKDGVVMVIAADGTPIQEVDDARFVELPFVAGVGANKRVDEFEKILAAGGDLRGRVRAGVLVGERRWNVKMTSGLDVRLPETNPAAAFAQFAQYVRGQRLLDKDLLYVDFRIPGRMFARLSEEAAAARAETQARKKAKAGPT